MTKEEAIQIAKQTVIDAGWIWIETEDEDSGCGVDATLIISRYWFIGKKYRHWHIFSGCPGFPGWYNHIQIDDETGNVLQKEKSRQYPNALKS